MPKALRQAIILVGVAFVSAGLSACASDINPVRDVFVGAGVGGAPKPAPDFVASTRPGSVDYMPVGVSAPARAMPAKSAAEVEAAKARLEQARTANEAQAATARRLATTPPPAPVTVEPLPEAKP